MSLLYPSLSIEQKPPRGQHRKSRSRRGSVALQTGTGCQPRARTTAAPASECGTTGTGSRSLRRRGHRLASGAKTPAQPQMRQRAPCRELSRRVPETSPADREITDRLLRIESDVSKLTITRTAGALAIAQNPGVRRRPPDAAFIFSTPDGSYRVATAAATAAGDCSSRMP
jgi:hypothetical protein